MSYVNQAVGAAPATPAASTGTLYNSSTDKVPRHINADGVDMAMVARSRTNLLRNSGMWFARRQPPATASTWTSLGGRVNVDGWGITTESNSSTYARVDARSVPEAGLSSPFYGSYAKITAVGKLYTHQVIEAVDVDRLRGKTVRLQVSAKQVVAATTLRMALIQLTSTGTVDTVPSGAALFITAHGGSGVNPTLGANLAFIAPKSGVSPDNCTVVSSALSYVMTTSWARFGGVFDVPADCKNLIVMIWSDSQLALTNGFAISQASLTEGMEIQDWTPLPYQEELVRSQRYYQKSFLVDTNPVTNIGVNNSERRGVAGKAGAVANSGFIPIQFEVGMRATPTVVLFNPAAANALARNITGAADMGATTITGTSANNFYTASTGVAATAVGDLIAIHFTADAEL